MQTRSRPDSPRAKPELMPADVMNPDETLKMRTTAIILVSVALLVTNGAFFGLFALASVSMASVEGVAQPWKGKLLTFWLLYHLPFVGYTVGLIRSRGESRLFSFRCISHSAWIAVPGAAVLFMFFGSRLEWVAMLVPIVQILVYIVSRRITTSPLSDADTATPGHT